MTESNLATNWPWLVAGGMFDLRTPLLVVQGYVRMLESDRAGSLTDKQRAMLREVQKAARQITEIVDSLSGLASLHNAGWGIKKENVSIGSLLPELANLPELQKVSPVDIQTHGEQHTIIGVPTLLRQALAGLARWVAWDQLHVERPLSIWTVDPPATSELWVVLAARDQIQEAVKTPRGRLSPLDDRPSRFSMDLPFASGIVRAHGGLLFSLPGGMPGAVVALPLNLNGLSGSTV